jgi:hypothetical protein
MLYSPLLQKVAWGGIVESDIARMEHGLSHLKSGSCTSLWPSLTELDCWDLPLSALQIAVLPIVNQLRQVSELHLRTSLSTLEFVQCYQYLQRKKPYDGWTTWFI